MKDKRIFFSILENIEKIKIKKQEIYIKDLYIQKKQYIQQLQLLINFRNEYIIKLNTKLKFGILINQLKIYNNFIFMLYNTIEENNNIIKECNENIKKNTEIWLKNRIQLKTWNYLNQKHQAIFKKHQILKENIISDEFIQYKYLKKRKYYDA